MSSLYNNICLPITLMADAAESITNGFMSAFNYASIDDFIRLMCWPHTDRNIEQHCKGLDEASLREIDTDIDDIQLMASKVLFDYDLKLFDAKWRAKESHKNNNFL